MVVIAIIGILSAIAVPSYRTYVIKSQITEAIVILQNLIQVGTVAYQTTGAVPSSISFGSFTVGINSITPYSGSKYVNSIFYNYDGNKVPWFCVQVYNINIPGILPSTTTWGTNSMICARTIEVNDIVNTYCGRTSTTDTRGVPIQYLPRGCSCTNIDSYSTNPGC
jgi:type IV pilus assembly protein PilA